MVLISSNKQSKLENPLNDPIIPEKKIYYRQGNKILPIGGKSKKDQSSRKKTYQKKK